MIEVGKSLPVYQEFAGPDPSSHTRLFLGHGNTKGARVCDICVCVCVRARWVKRTILPWKPWCTWP